MRSRRNKAMSAIGIGIMAQIRISQTHIRMGGCSILCVADFIVLRGLYYSLQSSKDIFMARKSRMKKFYCNVHTNRVASLSRFYFGIQSSMIKK